MAWGHNTEHQMVSLLSLVKASVFQTSRNAHQMNHILAVPQLSEQVYQVLSVLNGLVQVCLQLQ